MLYNFPTDNPINVHAREYDLTTRWGNSDPFAFVRAPGSNAGRNPLTLRYLAINPLSKTMVWLEWLSMRLLQSQISPFATATRVRASSSQSHTSCVSRGRR